MWARRPSSQEAKIRMTDSRVENYGRIEFSRNEIIFTAAASDRGWHLRLDEVRVFGEYTNQNGPFADDWFLVFLRADDEYWFEAPVHAEGAEQLLELLRAQLNIDTVECKLAHSTDFESRVMWPRELAEQPLFQFTGRQRDGLLRNIFGTQRVDQAIAPAVVEYLKANPNVTSDE